MGGGRLGGCKRARAVRMGRSMKAIYQYFHSEWRTIPDSNITRLVRPRAVGRLVVAAAVEVGVRRERLGEHLVRKQRIRSGRQLCDV
jgi:hypothetical protein